MLEQQQAFLRQGSAGRSPQGLLRAGERAAGGEAHCQAGACWGRSKAYLLCLSWASASRDAGPRGHPWPAFPLLRQVFLPSLNSC